MISSSILIVVTLLLFVDCATEISKFWSYTWDEKKILGVGCKDFPAFRELPGVSSWIMQSKSALRGRRINNFIDLWYLVASGGLGICVSSTNFQNNDICWPQQPPTERVSDISENFDFFNFKLSFYVKIIETHARAFLTINILAIGSVINIA